ncbi:MAG: hypothetical protein IAE91_09275 [Ignavibacteriaceae bacterium]|nr:hypothetical protein [Ignavibacteriaceae bacterium]
MFSFDEKKAWIDELIIKCWSDGFSAINRKHGKYLPEPPKIGDYDIDFLAKMNKDFAIGIVITDDDVSAD